VSSFSYAPYIQHIRQSKQAMHYSPRQNLSPSRSLRNKTPKMSSTDQVLSVSMILRLFALGIRSMLTIVHGQRGLSKQAATAL